MKHFQPKWHFFTEPMPYESTVVKMQHCVDNIISQNDSSQIWVLQHPHLYTAGISAKQSDLLNSNIDIPIYQTNRGGKYTYHGPGIKIIYVLFDLKQFFAPSPPDISAFVNFLENWLIATLKHYHIESAKRSDRVGLWITNQQPEKKIAAIGIKLKKWVSYHGIAINIDPDLSYFNNIVPCGLSADLYGITSLKKIAPSIDFTDFDRVLKNEFYNILQSPK
jgi:lipoyl(octanoyl) transferase